MDFNTTTTAHYDRKDKGTYLPMTKIEEAQSIIYGSFLLYFIDSLLDKKDRFNGTTIRLKTMLNSKCKKANNSKYVELSNEIWVKTIAHFLDRKLRIAIYEVVETLGLETAGVMTKMFGTNYEDNIGYFALKHSGDIEREIVLESREVCEYLIEQTRKVVFDNKGGL